MNPSLFRVLPGLPAYGPLPVGFSPDGQGLHQEGYVVEFLPDTPGSWVGNFQPGGTQSDLVVEHPDGRHLLVIARGQGYLVDPFSRRLIHVLEPDISLVLPLRDRNQILLSTYTELELVGTSGPVWRTRRISWDGMRQIRQEGNQVKGQAWSPADDAWHEFVLDLDSGQVDGGSYPAEGSL